METHVPVSPEAAWQAFNEPKAITQWNFATREWCCPRAEVELQPGGRNVARMEARDGSMGFDFKGNFE
ncbi:SRPBCC domain-containing protein [Qipengyuania algicida]|uniref:SRPBCC domain-containing protein n=1 Tax=Qipengyuania algicida TaxID=1836209 RepID=UPI003B014329